MLELVENFRLSLDCTYWAVTFASTAIDTGICINLSGSIHRDSANWTSSLTCATSYTHRLVNKMCHNNTPFSASLKSYNHRHLWVRSSIMPAEIISMCIIIHEFKRVTANLG